MTAIISSVPSAVLRRMTGIAPAVATCGALLSASIAILGYTLLGFLFLTRYYAPASHHYVRPLHFDYTDFVAVAEAPLSPNLREQAALDNSRALTGPVVALVPKSRFLPSGSQVAVHVYLVIPSSHTDLFQVTGELLTNTSRVAARSTRTHINTRQPYTYRLAKQLLFLPLHVLGWGHGDWVYVDLPLFDGYEERDDAPVVAFRARLASRNASGGGLPPPPVHRAEVHVRLRLGLLRTFLFWLRPGLAATALILLVGLTTALGGTTGTLALVALAFMLRRWAIKASAEHAKKRHGGGALPIAPAPRRKHHLKGGDEQPYGSLEDAVSYSVAHAQFYRGEERRHRRSSLMGQDEDGGSSATGMPYARQEQQYYGGKMSQSRVYDGGVEDTVSYNMNGGGRADSPAWSGSSDAAYPSEAAAGGVGGAPAAASAAHGYPSSRQGSGATLMRAARVGSATPLHDGGSDIKAGGARGYDSAKRAGSGVPHNELPSEYGQEHEQGYEQRGGR